MKPQPLLLVFPLLSAALIACATQVPTTATPPQKPKSQATSIASTQASISSSQPSSKPAIAAGMKLVSIVPWGLEMLIPERANSGFEPANQVFQIAITSNIGAKLAKINKAAPQKPSDLPSYWKQGDELNVLEEGSLPDGVFYCAVTFEVRVGVPGRNGLHMLETVSRVYVIKPFNATSYIECTAYAEFDLEKSPTTLSSLRDMCLSIK
jgi:hypothetical protein